jgi:hypothetical protein
MVYNGSFSEVNAMVAGSASATLAFNWYDRVSFTADDIIVFNPGSDNADIYFTLGGAPVGPTPRIAPNGYYVANFPGSTGGPLVINAYGLFAAPYPILASQRVSYNQSFHEVDPLGFP